MLEELRERAGQAVELARAAGAADVFATVSRRRNVSTEQRNDAIERVQESTSRGLRLRLYVDNRYSEHNTSDLHPDRLSAFVREAVAITRALDEDRDRVITPPELYDNRPTENIDQIDQGIKDLTPAARRTLCGEIAATARQHDAVISASVSVNDRHGAMAAASSNGFQGDQEWTAMGLSSHVTLRGEGDARPDGSYRTWGIHAGDLPDAGDVGRKSLERATARLGTTQGPTVRATMVVEPMHAVGLIRRLLGPANAEAVSQERSYFCGRLGQPMFNERLTITDNPLIPRALGSRHFDGEGISGRSIPIVDAGRAANIYVDTYYGRKAELPPTTGSSSNVVVTPGDRSMEQLIADAGEGVLVTTWIGGNADPTTGQFSMGMRGHMIEDGRVGRPVGEMNVSGELIELFSHLTAVGNDPWVYSSYRVPTLVFENVQFSGA